MTEFEAVPNENKMMMVAYATGEVRDADGNLLNQVELAGEPIEITQSQYDELMKGQS